MTDPLLFDLRRVLLRDLDTLRREIELYPDDATLWKAVPGLPNPGGTLALHLAGNLRHFIGAGLGGSDYVRNRPAEFSRRDLTRADLLRELDAAIREVADALPALETGQLDAEFPVELGGTRIGTRRFLFHLASHLAYHLGQVDFHRRAATGAGASAGAMSIPELVNDDAKS